MPTFEDAIILAARAYRGKVDKEGQPKIFHVLRVMLRFNNANERIVAVLHDLIKDDGFMLDHLRTAGYSEEILQALDCLTRRENESYEQFIERVKENPIAREVRIADLEDNVDLKRHSRHSVFTEENLKLVRKYQSALLQFRIQAIN